MKYCPNCGFKLASDYKVCPQCGYHLPQKKSATAAVTKEIKSQHLSRVQAHQHQQAPLTSPLLQYLNWLKHNLITVSLVVLLVILTYIYVGKIISVVVAIGMIIWGYIFANHQAAPLDAKLKLMFRRVEHEEETKVQRVLNTKTNTKVRDATIPVPIQPPKYQTVKTTSRRSWIVSFLAIITWSTSYWPGFFADNSLGVAIGWNSPTVPSLSQMIRQAIMYLNFNFHLQINPSLGLWLLALGPVIVLLGSLMPSRFGRKLAVRGAIVSVIVYLGGLAILKMALSWGSRYLQLPTVNLGSSGYVAIFCVILMLILTIIAKYRQR
ncbi:zinc ribbon domain-containing protein [Bombilactobacillus bombi]|uniref:zinc-ribbon domain-containing protein n=1 Tax=Bombilactobacillus bombi TaxID=1303590 RepID=UPI000E597433|nr:zinc ribbon domain-containing protein [Bombilactobacillus bombi]AXX65181.1 zinc ribbon domain-containing protein [Bombilactobacillus bombi]